MDALIFVIFVLAALGRLFYIDYRYKKTSYYQITKKSYWVMDKGSHGEYLIYKYLRHLEDDGSKFLFNIFLPKRNGETTEIDVLLIGPKGLLVFESKNFGGWIFGNSAHKSWMQIFPKGRGHSHKVRFYNPVMQNASHIAHLRNNVHDDVAMWSLIVFSDSCILKDVTINSKNVSVINLAEVRSVVSQIYGQTQIVNLTEKEISTLYDKFYSYAQANHEIKKQHAVNISNKNSPHH